MASEKDKDYHMLRHPEKYSELGSNRDTYGNLTKGGAEAYRRYKVIWSKYGNKSMVCDKRRRNSTRKSNQKDKQILHQMERAQFKSNLRNHLANEDQPILTPAGSGNIIFVK
ncbi:hypothetical protein [Mucilaginibacter antarcticus]|uniref:Uncharacterized protein n=1 Tax=Mucilaginibacter antarcticus TaxID=1855725 RepID=A0ABW5XPF6_9SPHI